MSTPERVRRRVRLSLADWVMTGLLVAAVGVSSAGLGAVLEGVRWWFQLMLFAVVVLLSAAIARMLVRAAWLPPLVGAVAGVLLLTLSFAPDTAVLGVVPTAETLEAFAETGARGWGSIAAQSVPALAVDGIRYLLCLAVAAACVAMDAAAFALRSPALAGVPLLVLLLVPSYVRSHLHDPLVFALVAALFLAMLLVRARRGGLRTAAGVGAVALVAALVAPILLPDVTSRAAPIAGGAASVNPILTLGNDLRRADPALALIYETTSTSGLYLRLTVLDDFSGTSWTPRVREQVRANEVDRIGPAPGLGEEIATEEVTTGISIGQGITSQWLPAPYAPVSIEGAEGRWLWEGDGLTLRSTTADARGQEYLVESLDILPTVQQLMSSRPGGTAVDARYTRLPAELPPVVGEVAQQVAGSLGTRYEQAVALQAFFREGDFAYSEDAPVQQGYDGSGAQVLGAFLELKSGYCVHFSSAMAAMARTLGIPARVAVGFAPGREVNEAGNIRYRVSTHDLHAWPELFFDGVGWVRFEPTPGRGIAPEFTDAAAVDDPATPDIDESRVTPEPAPAPTAAPELPRDDLGALGETPADAAEAEAQSGWQAWWLAVPLLALLVPAAVRLARRAHRMRLVRGGSARDAWAELLDTAIDLGLADGSVLTPRGFAAELERLLGPRGRAALQRLLDAVETEAFAETPAIPRAPDVHAVLWALRRHARPRALLGSWLAPRTVLQGLWAQSRAWSG